MTVTLPTPITAHIPLEDYRREFNRAFQSSCGLDRGRTYLGLSALPRCAHEIVRSYRGGRFQTNQSETNLANAQRGFTLESRLKQILVRAGILRTTAAARWDANGFYVCGSEREIETDIEIGGICVRGNIDGETMNGELVEIKSLRHDKYLKAVQIGRIRGEHFQQVQGYMHFGGYAHTLVVYLCAETFETHLFGIAYQPAVGEDLDVKARAVLTAIAEGRELPCECGRCDRR